MPHPLFEPQPLPRRPLPIVIIGAGGIVRDAHLPAYRLAGFTVAALHDVDVARATALARDFGVPQVAPTLADAVRAAPPDAVFDLAVPAPALREVLAALPDGAAVLMQKPFGENLADARALLDLCHRKHLRAAVNFQLRYAPCIALARQLVASGAIGELHDLEVRVTGYMPWHRWTFLEGAPRLEILYHSIHYVDLIRSFLGEPDGVHARTVKHPHSPRLAATRTAIALGYGESVRATITTNHGHEFGLRHQESYVKWEGTRGAIKARLGLLLNYPVGGPDQLEYCTLDDAGVAGEWQSLPLSGHWYPHAFIGTMSELMRCATGEIATMATAVEDAFKTMAVVEAAYESSASGATPVRSARDAARVVLRGITWDHSRGYLPMVATAQRFGELHPATVIRWEKRSLKDFEDLPAERLAADYDLIVLDHPSISQGALGGGLLPLDEHLAPEFLADQAAHAVGASHASYAWAGHQWALAIDAATPVAFWREDLLLTHGLAVPRTWEETIALARRGHVEVPAAPINCLMNFYSLCLAQGETPFAGDTVVVTRPTGLAALSALRELLAHCAPGVWERNPIASHDLVASAANPRLCYCPLAYGYSNYARDGYAAHRLTFGEPPTVHGAPLTTVLGGAGLGVSALRPHRGAAVAYAAYVAAPATQTTLYARSGGQPGHRAAWLDAENNRLTGDYFARTLPVLDRAFLRPRYDGHLRFQERGALLVHAALRGALADPDALAQLDALYRDSLPSAPRSP